MLLPFCVKASVVCSQLFVLLVIFPSCFHHSEVSRYQKTPDWWLISAPLEFSQFRRCACRGLRAQLRQHMVSVCLDMFSKKEDEGPVGGIDVDFFIFLTFLSNSRLKTEMKGKFPPLPLTSDVPSNIGCNIRTYELKS